DIRKIAVDALIVSAGWTPSVHLFSQSRGKLRWDEANQRFLPDLYAQDCVSIGACNGTDDLAEAIDEAISAGGGRIAVRGESPFAWTGGMIGAGEGAGPDTLVKA